MSDSVYELVEQSCQTLRLDLSTLECNIRPNGVKISFRAV